MARIVQKFGGTSVATVERIRAAALKTKAEYDAGHQVAVVVSAMSGVTNRLVGYCQGIGPRLDAREYDTVVASGEQVTSGLMALALQNLGISARSWMGWQLPLSTDDAHSKARIRDVGVSELEKSMAAGEVPVMAGFQGISEDARITTLGRGGSDTSAVALAAALKADRCDIYTDVNGVYTCDPRIVTRARKLARVTYEEMLEMASQGAKVLQTRSVEMAMNHKVPVQVLSSFEDAAGSSLPGTMVVDEGDIMEHAVVSGIAYNRDEAKITVVGVPDRPGIAAAIFGPLNDAAINVDMIVQNVSEDGLLTNLTFTAGKTDLERALEALASVQGEVGYSRVIHDSRVVKVSIIGVGMRSHTGVAQSMFRSLAEKGINIQVISTSEIKISVLIAEEYAELALRTLHSAYGLDVV